MAQTRSLRESRLFQADGSALVVAMDHARRARQVTGLIRANEIIETVVGAGADALLLPHGSAVAASAVVGSAGVWLSVDPTPATASGAVERALRLGVDGIKIEIYPYSGDRQTLENLSAMASECVPASMSSLRNHAPRNRKYSFLEIPAVLRLFLMIETGTES